MENRLKNAREYLRLSLEFVAKNTGIDAGRLREIESGACKATKEELKRLSNLYGIGMEKQAASMPEEYKEFMLGVPESDSQAVGRLIDLKVSLGQRK